MRLYYYKDAKGNFGDDLNPWMWNTLAPGLLDDDDASIFIGIGTLLNARVPQAPKKVVFGSGVGYGQTPLIDDKWKIYCVRGPLSAAALGVDKALAITDPAALLTQIFTVPAVKTGKVYFMPHHRSTSFADWKAVCAIAGLGYLDPAADVKETVEKIRGARMVVTEAMHGAIVADAFRVPWIPVECYDHILGFKWNDWCQSLQLPYRPVKLDSLFDMDKHLSFEDLAKTRMKRALLGIGIWRSGWGAPGPKTNLRRHQGCVIEALIGLAKSPDTFLSTDLIHRHSIDRLMTSLDRLKQDCSTEWKRPIESASV
jgi:succinoglycan biosynthesis protein ExoV